MCWCPITTLDEADEAYEWNMGQFPTDWTRADGTWTARLSKDLASSFADYIAGLVTLSAIYAQFVATTSRAAPS